MLEAHGNIFNQKCDALCITTNGFVKQNGEAVMGRGCAKELVDRYWQMPKVLGNLINTRGNVVNKLGHFNDRWILSFPVKPTEIILSNKNQVVRHMQSKFSIDDFVPGWACVADINIIIKSANQLVELTDKNNWQKVILPRPGCGAGELSWAMVKQELNKILDDRFICMTF